MEPRLDRVMVPTRNKRESAKLLAELLGVPWTTAGVTAFAPVFLNDAALNFCDWPEPLPQLHYCLRVDDADFDAILVRLIAARIAFRSSLEGPVDRRIATEHDGRILYWNEPDGHHWELVTASYARPA